MKMLIIGSDSVVCEAPGPEQSLYFICSFFGSGNLNPLFQTFLYFFLKHI